MKNHLSDLIRIAGAAVALTLSLLGILPYMIIPVAATLICGYPMFKEAFDAIRERHMTMELSMSIAVLAALAAEQYTTGLVITLFVLVAELLEHLIVDRGRDALTGLAALLPQTAKDLQPGDTVVVRPGAHIPVDGIVLKGNSFVNQAAITGESLPVEKGPNSEVLAGTINQDGVLEVIATSIGKDTIFGRIIGVMESVQSSQSPIEKTADKLAARLVYFALGGALITWLVTHNMNATISALVVAGACGVAAGTPLAILAGIGRAAREGVVIKGGVYLEQLAKADTVLLDKTGTLTLNKAIVTDVSSFNGIDSRRLLQLLSTGEQHSDHPLAGAIMEAAKNEDIQPGAYDNYNYLPGKGLQFSQENEYYLIGNTGLFEEKKIDVGIAAPWLESAREQGESTVLIGTHEHILGGVRLVDLMRPEAREAISDLHDHHLKIILLSGDHTASVSVTGRKLRVDEAVGNLLPTDKLAYIQQLKAAGKKVIMVGDGINDAPALMEAHVGIAMGTASNIAFESADMVLTNNDLRKVGVAIGIAKQCMNVIQFNFWGTIIVDAVGIVLAFMGYLSPMAAAMIHVISELIFILNSARLFRKR
ncbi:heavy metal translocating P-type ATPase [Chitinophaga silvisoli]|uniref:P-type Zn(2+) transporter n=1 Tax=Chitinophaga silvisoli TaxID=2291814 RepID=A0A3E1NUJ1_9BACT|nr:cation-translocating P-type ATPase [Chitinophaga silvisoli]RFM31418.1 cation-transporting P-type ATPase [Chitinophaga silvisoli]